MVILSIILDLSLIACDHCSTSSLLDCLLSFIQECYDYKKTSQLWSPWKGFSWSESTYFEFLIETGDPASKGVQRPLLKLSQELDLPGLSHWGRAASTVVRAKDFPECSWAARLQGRPFWWTWGQKFTCLEVLLLVSGFFSLLAQEAGVAWQAWATSNLLKVTWRTHTASLLCRGWITTEFITPYLGVWASLWLSW